MFMKGTNLVTPEKSANDLLPAACYKICFPLILVFITISCVTEFIPQVSEEKELLVVEGLITDQPEPNIIKLTKSLPLGKKSEAIPLGGCNVTISDNLGNKYYLNEKSTGTYVTDPAYFRGVIGRFYTLNIRTSKTERNLTYESYPVEMKPVPQIDSVYYEKTIIKEKYENFPGTDGCQIYLNTNDPGNSCRFYRWDYDECWILRLLWPVDNMKCWIYDRSKSILIKSTASINESTIDRYPVTYITNETDRLKMEYSIMVNQYSLNEEEYNFWDNLKTLTEQVGGLYDVVPYSIPGNLYCLENQTEKVLGYFSVSAKSSKRIFIEDSFAGIVDQYADCISDTIPTDYPESIEGINKTVWALLVKIHTFTAPGYTIITERKGCADCTVRGTTVEPDFWSDRKK